MSFDNLRIYFDRLTARPRRTEILLGLAYGVLVASLLSEERSEPALDEARLEWGSWMRDYVGKAIPSTSILAVGPTDQMHVVGKATDPATTTIWGCRAPHLACC